MATRTGLVFHIVNFCIGFLFIVELFSWHQSSATLESTFVPENEPIHIYLERLQFFMDANNVKKEKQNSFESIINTSKPL